MASRREFLGRLSSILAASTVRFEPLMGQQRALSLPPGIGVEPDYSGPLPKLRGGGTLGDRPPLNGEEKIAKAIITRAPVGPTPFEVAKFFLAVAKGEYGKQWQPYAQGWPVRWNPVIVNFFQATSTTPEGDVTAWCAAFVNWCFLRAGKGNATHSASSGSFRTFGVETASPSPGDIVVFRRVNTNENIDPRGHVGFFVETVGDKILVLGGNQIEGHESSHMVSSKPFGMKNAKLTFHSFRTDARLHV
jgi:uncharacterized protein (TIGR02594 family)